jgi:putative cell wall-binding protein
VYLATGGGFADALAASAAAGSIAAPVLLVRPQATALDAATIALIKKLGATRIIIAGGRGVVSTAVESSAEGIAGVTEVIRLAGTNRYATAAALNAFAFGSAESAYIVSGLDFPDALAAAAAAGAKRAPLHLSNGICTPTPSLQHLVDTGVERVAFAGGTGVLKSTVTEFLTCG